MAQVKSPLMSQDATGRMPGGLQVGHWKGRHVIGRRRRPRQPRTEAQLATRTWQTFLATQWKTLSTAEQASWESNSPEASLPNYNKYLRFNTNLYKNLHSAPYLSENEEFLPAVKWPPTRDTLASNWGGPWESGGVGTATFGFNLTATHDNWFVIYHHAGAPAYNCTFRNLLYIEPLRRTGAYEHTFTNLQAGIFRIGFVLVSRTGKPRAFYYFRLVTVT